MFAGDINATEFSFPPDVSMHVRTVLQQEAGKFGLSSTCRGEGTDRYLTLEKRTRGVKLPLFIGDAEGLSKTYAYPLDLTTKNDSSRRHDERRTDTLSYGDHITIEMNFVSVGACVGVGGLRERQNHEPCEIPFQL